MLRTSRIISCPKPVAKGLLRELSPPKNTRISLIFTQNAQEIVAFLSPNETFAKWLRNAPILVVRTHKQKKAV
jgi:hypothetical protein